MTFYDSLPICPEGEQRPPASRSVQVGQAASVHRLPAAARQTDLSHSSSALMSAVTVPISEMSQLLSPGAQAPQASQCCGEEVPGEDVPWTRGKTELMVVCRREVVTTDASSMG